MESSSLGRKSLEERMEKIFKIFEKTCYRKNTTNLLAGRCGPKVQKSRGRKLQFSLLELFKNGSGGGGWEYLGKEQMSLHRKSFKYRLNDHPQRTTWKEIPFWIRARTR